MRDGAFVMQMYAFVIQMYAFVIQMYAFVMQMYKAGGVIGKQMVGHGWPATGDRGQRDAEIRNDGR
jgi:hypothetical protein